MSSHSTPSFISFLTGGERGIVLVSLTGFFFFGWLILYFGFYGNCVICFFTGKIAPQKEGICLSLELAFRSVWFSKYFPLQPLIAYIFTFLYNFPLAFYLSSTNSRKFHMNVYALLGENLMGKKVFKLHSQIKPTFKCCRDLCFRDMSYFHIMKNILPWSGTPYNLWAVSLKI